LSGVLQISGTVVVAGVTLAFNTTLTAPDQATAQAFVTALKALFASSSPNLTFAYTDQKVLS
jgi:hypothetical protein